MQLPSAFEARMRSLLKTEYDAFLEALTREDAVKGLRVNPQKASVEAFEENSPFALTPLPYVEGGYIVADEEGAGKHPYHHAGVYYMQDPGAMSTVAALPKELFLRDALKILDLCAAPGGKTTQLAAACAPTGGAVVANEYNASRARILAGNVERLGLSNVCVTNVDTKYIAQWYPSLFDLVVIDAPCSGEGMFRKNDRAIEEWSEENVRMCAVRQREILANGAQTVRPDGYLLYSTCTYAVEENEAVILDFLKAHPGFSLCPCNASVIAYTADGIEIEGKDGHSLSLCRRFYPHRAAGEGQFIALLHRDADATVRREKAKSAIPAVDKRDAAVAEAFLRETIGRIPEGLLPCGGMLSIFPHAARLGIAIPPFGLVALGCTLGEVRKGRIVPHHHFFTCFGQEFSSRAVFSPDGEQIKKYLLGEEVDAGNARGYSAVLVALGKETVALGGAKAADGRLKNYYPKGLRTK